MTDVGDNTLLSFTEMVFFVLFTRSS